MDVAFPGSIPYPLTPLIDREHEQAALSELLIASPRLVTVIGPGGVGKSSLAIHTSVEMVRQTNFAGAFVDLSLIMEDVLVLPTVASALGVVEVGKDGLNRVVKRVLHARPTLLLFDNCEHLASLGTLVTELLRSCPQLRILATSQAPLHVVGEHRFPLRPLHLPALGANSTPDEALATGAVALFVQAAKASDPEFQLTARNVGDVVAVCRILDGLPLAIELAAARCGALSVQELKIRLERNPFRMLVDHARSSSPRHRSLQALLDWSFDLLDQDEALLFRKLAVFAGGFTVAAAEAVMYPDMATGFELVNGLTSLVNKSLLRRHTSPGGLDRYQMLETVRAYSWDKLEASHEVDVVCWRHALWAVGLVEHAESQFFGPDEQTGLGILDDEQANWRTALDWLLHHEEAELSLRMCGSLADYWYLRGEFTEGITWLERTLALAAPPSAARAKALVGAGLLGHVHGQLAKAMAWSTEGLELARAHWGLAGVAEALAILGNVYQHQGLFEEATTLHRESLTMFRELGAMEWVAVELLNLSVAASGMGMTRLAATYIEESLAVGREANDVWSICYALRIAADLAVQEKNTNRAIAVLDEGFHLSLQRRDLWGIADCLSGLANVAALEETFVQAAEFLGAAEALYERLGIALPPPDRPFYGQLEKELRHILGPAEYLQARQTGQGWSLADAEDAVQRICRSFSTPDGTTAGTSPSQWISTPELTSREQQILNMLTEGKTNREIATELHLSHRTIGWHISNILEKLSVSSRTSAAVHAALAQSRPRVERQNPVK